MAAPGNFTTLAASGAVTFSSGATSGYYWTCSNGSGLGLWTAPPTVGQYSSINLTSGATIGKVWQCTDSITGAGAWVSVASLSTGGAFTISNDTNITATLTGSSSTALFTPITLNLAWFGVLPVSRGGTGYNGVNLTLGDLLYASNGSVTTRLPGNTTTTRKFLISQGNGATAAAPFWDIIQGSDIGSIVTSFTSAGFGIAAQSNSHIATSNRTGVAGVNYQIALGGLYTAINTTTDIKDLDITTTHKSSATGLISSEGISIETNLDATLGTITEHCSLHIHAGTNAGGTVTTAYGAHIMTPTYGVTNYALWTEDVTIGSATPWSLLALDANNKVTSIAPYSGGFGTYVLTWTGGTSHPTWQVPTGGGGGGSGITSGTGTANQILLNGTTATQFSASTFSLATTLIAPGSVQSTTTMAIVSAVSSTAGLLNGFAFTGAAGSYYGYNSTGTFSLTSSTTAQTAALNIANIISTSGATVTLGAGIINSPTLRNTSGTFTTAYAYYSKPIATGTTTIGTYATLYLDTPTATGTLTTTYTAYFAAPPTAATASVAVWADSIQIGGTILAGNAGSGNVNFGSSSISATSLLATDGSKNLTTTTSAITPTFAGIVLGTLSGILKATTGTVSTATAGTDYEPPITAGTAAQYFKGNKTLGTFSTDVQAQISASGNLSYSTGNVTLNTTITGLTSVSSTTFVGALTGNSSTATALSTAGAANQFWKNGNVWAQPTQADISGLTTGSSPTFTGLTLSGLASGDVLAYFNTSKALAAVTLNSNLTLTTGTLALNTTISGLTSVSSTSFTGALTGNASTATALSTSGAANQFWKNGNVWAQPTQADISGLTTSSSPSFTGVTVSGATGDTLTYFNTSKALTSATLSSNLTLTTGTLDTVQGIQTTSNPQFNSLGIGTTAPGTAGYARINTRLGIGGAPSYPLDVTGQVKFSSSLSLNGSVPNTYTMFDMNMDYTTSATGDSYGMAINGTMISAVLANTSNSYAIYVNPLLRLAAAASGGSEYACIKVAPKFDANTFTIANVYGLYIIAGVGYTGTITTAYGSYVKVPTAGTTNIASYTDNMAIGTAATAPPTNGLLVSGPIKNTNVTASTLMYADASQQLASVTLNSNLTLTTGTLALNTTISGLTSVSSTGFTGALTGNASTATALSTSGAANQFWKNGNVWAQPTQADISGLTTGSSPSFTGITLSGATGDTLTYFNTSKALTSATLSSNLTLTTGTLDTVQGIQTTSNPQFNSLGIGTAAPATTGYARINVRLGIAMAPTYPLDVTGQSRLSSSLSLNGTTPNTYTALDIGTGFTATGASSSYGANISGTLVGAVSAATCNIYGINISSVLKLPSSATSECAGIKITPSTDANTFTIANSYGLYIAAGSNVSGTVTTAYGGYFAAPGFGTTKIALWANDITLNTATAFAPLATDTNKNVVSLTTGISNVGWVLTSTGASSVPTWQAVSGGSGVPSVTGTADQILINGGTSAVTTAATFTIPSSFIAPGSIQSTLTMGVGMAVSTDFGINLNYTYSGAIPFYTGGVHVTGTITVTGGTADTIAGVYIEPTFDFQSSTSSITAGIYSAPWFKATAGSSHSWYGIHNAPFLTNTGASDYYYGYFSDTAINLVSNLSAIYGIASNIRVTAGSGTITNAYNIYVDRTSKLSGTVTTAYGLYVNNPTAGTTNIALYSANANLNYVGVAPPTGGMIMSGKLGVGNNNPTNQLEVTGTARFSSSVICATGALATTATDGYIYIPSCAGIPTGVPTSQTGTCAMAYDTTNNDLYIYDGTWQKATLNASDVSFESINNNEACYAYSITYDGSNRYSTITYTAPGGNIVKTFSYNGDGTINTIVLSGAGLPTIAYTTKTYTYTSGSLTSVAYS